MQLPRSFFFALLVAGAIPVLAADKESLPPQPAFPAQTQAALTRGPYARQFLARAGLLLTEDKTRVDLGHPLVPGSTLVNETNPPPFQAVLEGQAKSQLAQAEDQRLLEQAEQAEAQTSTIIIPSKLPDDLANADGLCYTMRMYKVKRTERLAGGESASRGYSTCELARNFQIRSAVAQAQSQQK